MLNIFFPIIKSWKLIIKQLRNWIRMRKWFIRHRHQRWFCLPLLCLSYLCCWNILRLQRNFKNNKSNNRLLILILWRFSIFWHHIFRIYFWLICLHRGDDHVLQIFRKLRLFRLLVFCFLLNIFWFLRRCNILELRYK